MARSPHGSAPDFGRVRALFDAAHEKPAAERQAFVITAAGDDVRLRDEVLAMLIASENAATPQLNDRSSPSVEDGIPAEPDAPVAPGATEQLLHLLGKSRGLDNERFIRGYVIGEGGMGKVVSLHDRHLNRRLAMKVQRDRGASATPQGARQTKELLSRFLEEAQITSQLDHPGVVPVHDLGLDQAGKVWFTMRLVKGRTADQVFADAFAKRDGWSTTRGIEVILKVCDTMSYAHDKGVLHRDLKPSNVMVGRFGEVYVMDWGLAKVMGKEDSHDLRIRQTPSADSGRIHTARKRDEDNDTDSPCVTMDGVQVGTPSYMSPEQAHGEELDVRADVYAIGSMIYELVAGTAPYTLPSVRKSPYRVLEDLVLGPPRPIEALVASVPAELVAIVDKAMDRNRSRRYPGPTALAADLRAFLGSQAVSAYRTGAIIEMQLWMRRNKPLAASLAATVLTMLVAIGVLTWKNHEVAGIAQQKTALAERQTRMARELASIGRLQSLFDTTEALWPESPDRIPPMESWLLEADRLTAMQPQLEMTLADLRSKANPPSPERDASDPQSHPRYAEWHSLEHALASRTGDETVTRQLLASDDRSVLLALDFDGYLHGANGEAPIESRSILFPHGITNLCGLFSPESRITFVAAPAINPLEGSVVLWIAPDWPEPYVPHMWLRLGYDGGILLGKDSLDNLRFIMNRFDRKECDLSHSIASWHTGEWHHVAFTWSSQRRHMHLYVDGRCVGHRMLTEDLPAVNAEVLHIGGDGSESPLCGAVDLLRVYGRPLMSQEVEILYVAQTPHKPTRESLRSLDDTAPTLPNSLNQPATWDFSSDEEGEARFLHDALADVHSGLAELATRRADVAQRLTWAKHVAAAAAESPHVTKWVAARDAISKADNVVASEQYAGKTIVIPEGGWIGLVPIGMNPITKLWEFYDLRSAWDGKLDPHSIPIPPHEADGSIKVTGETGIVFVLLPGGAFTMGAQNTNPGGIHYDPKALPDEMPHEVHLDPFLLARHELTRGQWRRLGAELASSWGAEGVRENSPFLVTSAHPADSIDWFDANLVLHRHGLCLPTEAQWEYGCRAGTSSPWWAGGDASHLDGCANLHDQTSAAHEPNLGMPVPFADGFAWIAPVGTFRANAFGLFDIHGNLDEWCRDWYSNSTPERAGDGYRPVGDFKGLVYGQGPDYGDRVYRGGTFTNISSEARSSGPRRSDDPSTVSSDLGLRPARMLPR